MRARAEGDSSTPIVRACPHPCFSASAQSVTAISLSPWQWSDGECDCDRESVIAIISLSPWQWSDDTMGLVVRAGRLGVRDVARMALVQCAGSLQSPGESMLLCTDCARNRPAGVHRVRGWPAGQSQGA
jgi:hypothetical protein